MSSQRHRQVVRNYGAECAAIAEKQPAAGYIRQLPGPFTVPVGPPGGPLQGSSLAGPAPAAIPAPTLEHPLLLLGLIATGGGGPLEPPDTGGERQPPDHPILITAIEKVGDGVGVTLNEDVDVRPGDSLVIEATGNTKVNGSYAVLQVNGRQVVVANMVDLPDPIEGKGRATLVPGN